MEFIKTDEAPKPVGPYSQGVAVNGFVFFSGQIALTPSGDFLDESASVQTDQILKNIGALLSAEGLTPKEVVKCTVFLTDMNDFPLVNKKYAAFFGSHTPARSCIGLASLPLGAKVEIEVTAVAKK